MTSRCEDILQKPFRKNSERTVGGNQPNIGSSTAIPGLNLWDF